MKKKILVGITAIALVAGGTLAYTRLNNADAAGDGQKKTGAAVTEPVKADGTVAVDGHLVPVQHAQLTFTTGGQVAEVLVAEGAQVKAGQVLARLESTRQRTALVQAQVTLQRAQARVAELKAGSRKEEVASAQAAVDAAKARLAQATRGADQEEVDQAALEVNRAQEELNRALENGQSGEIEAARSRVEAAESKLVQLTRSARPEEVAASEAEVRRAQAQLDLLLAGPRPESLAAAEADVASAVQGVKQAEVDLANTELKAPFDGVVAVLELKAGEVVGAGAPAVRLADLSGWEVVTDDLTELSVTRIQEGTPVTIRFDAIPDLEMDGKVTRIRPWGEQRQGDMTYVVTIQPEGKDERLRWNMTASVTFEGDVKK